MKNRYTSFVFAIVIAVYLFFFVMFSFTLPGCKKKPPEEPRYALPGWMSIEDEWDEELELLPEDTDTSDNSKEEEEKPEPEK